MTDDSITIEVNGRPVAARKGQMLIEVTDANGIYIPRFCYHKKLTVAANCRMCLVEVEKAPKPLPACATPVTDGMKVFTSSPLAVEAQKAVMEFLLINHPLDCPICDQGGECELQDLAMGYGRDISRYQEKKRVVKDKNIGPLVQTDMTRCIHCTRCVRFGEEIAGMRELGATGRGEHMQIGTYVEKSMASEMSGNVIDLCPVGALTSKPFRFSARTWEMRQYEGIAPHDGVGSNIHFHTMGQRVKRVVPAENEAINEVWLSDRDRFSYEGLYSADRLHTPLVKQGDAWREVDWQTAFEVLKDRLELIRNGEGTGRIGALAAAGSTTEELYLLQKLLRGLGSNNIDHRVQQADFSDQDQAPAFPWLGQYIADLERRDAALIIGGNPRKQQPIINHRLRKAVRNGGAIMLVNPVDYETNLDVAVKDIVAPDRIAASLAGIIKALLDAGRQLPDETPGDLVAGITPDPRHRDIAGRLADAGDNATVLLGDMATTLNDYATIRYLAGVIAALTGARFGYLSAAANTSGAWVAGAVPHRLAGGASASSPGLHARAMLEERLAAYLLLNLEPELDCQDPVLALDALRQAQCVVAMTAFRTPALDDYADILLPLALYAENEGSYVNMEGRLQTFDAVVKAPGEARPAWKILRVLGNTFNVDGFGYNTVDDINNEVQVILDSVSPDNQGAWKRPDGLPQPNGSRQRLTDIPANSADSLVRRAAALQQTVDVADGAVHINPEDARTAGISNGDRVTVIQQDREQSLPAVIDARLPADTVMIHAAHPDIRTLGPWAGEITIKHA